MVFFGIFGCFCGKLAPVGAAADLIWFTHNCPYVLNTNSASFSFVSKPGVGPCVFMLYSQTQFLFYLVVFLCRLGCIHLQV